MIDTIIHDGAFTVTLDTKDSPTTHVAGACPTLDDLARQRAHNVYYTNEAPQFLTTYKEVI